MSWGYRCIGGPLDGQIRACEPGQTSFAVAEFPASPVMPYDSAIAAAPCMQSCKNLVYALQEHRVYGYAWVLESATTPASPAKDNE